MDESKFYALRVTATTRYAHPGEPARPQVQLYANMEYAVPQEVPFSIAKTAVNNGWAEAVEISAAEAIETAHPAFDVEGATRDQLKAFVKANPALGKQVNLNASTDVIREAVSDYIQAQV